jgi:hypothetical protein
MLWLSHGLSADKLWENPRGAGKRTEKAVRGHEDCRCGGFCGDILWISRLFFPQPPVEDLGKIPLSTALVENQRGVFRLFHGESGRIFLSAYGNLEISTNYSSFRCVKLLLFHTVFHNLWKRKRMEE